MNKNYIELNGKRYDAVTGVLLGSAPTTQQQPASPIKKIPKSRLAMDMTTRTVSVSADMTPKPARKSRTHHGGPKVIAAHKPQSTATLMRHVVSKPHVVKKPALKQAYPIKKAASEITVRPKRSVHKVDTTRLRRAGQVSRSPHIARFEAKTVAPIRPRVRPVAVKSAPAAITPVAQVAKRQSVPATMHDKKTQLFEQALATARSHEQPVHTPPKKSFAKRKQKTLSTFAALAVVMVVGGFVLYANKGSVSLQVASARAGFQATMPSYKPVGFTQESTDAKEDKVAINFVSPMSGDTFTLTQQSSDWNSQTLFDSLVANNGPYRTVQRNGSTIYIYDKDKAAWVDGGILYQVVGNAKLSSDDIISLATSM